MHWQQAAEEIDAEERALAAQKPSAETAPREEDAPVRSRPVTSPPPRPASPTPAAAPGGGSQARRGKSK